MVLMESGSVAIDPCEPLHGRDPTALSTQRVRNAGATAECGARGASRLARLVLPLAVRDVPALLLGSARLSGAVGGRRLGRVL